MTVAFDAVSLGNGTGDISWTHTPVGTPRGALVLIAQNVGATNEITSVTYGGVAMTAVSGSPALHATGEDGAAYAYFLGAGIPAGAQTVLVDVPSAGSSKRAMAITLTATTDTEVVAADATIASDSLANPSVTLPLNGRTSFAALAFQSGQNAPASTTPLTNWTDRGEFDFGTQVSGLYTYDIIASTDVTAGWTQTAEDAVMIAVAVSEVQVVTPPPPSKLAAVLALLLLPWQPMQPAQPARVEIAPTITAAAPAAVNDPPFDARRPAYKPIYSAWKWRAIGSGDAGQALQADPVPPVTRHPEILASWAPPAALPQLGNRTVATLPGASIDPPPIVGTTPATRRATIGAWYSLPPLPQRSPPFITGSSVDPPPPIARAAVTAITQASWMPAPGLPPRAPGLLQPTAEAVNDPPFGLRPSAPTILGSWVPPRLPVVAPTRAPIPTVVAQVDNPPPLTRQPLAIMAAWQPLPALQPARPDVVQEGAAPAVDNPTPSARPLAAILSAWQPSPQATQRAPQTPQVAAAVADVPPTTRPWLGPILAGWQAPTLPVPPRPWLAALPGVSVDPPPIQRPPSLAIIHAAWEPPAPLPTLPGHLAQERPPDAPPFGLRSWLPATLRAWQPGPPAAQWGRHLPVVVTHVPVNDPPFGIRPWLPTLRALWIPGPPQPITRPIVATESGPSTQIPLLVVTAVRIQRAHADGIWVSPARATAPRVVKAHATGIWVTPAMATAPRIQRAHATNVRIFGG